MTTIIARSWLDIRAERATSLRILRPAAVVFAAVILFTIARYSIYQSWMAFVDYDGYFNYFIARWGFDTSKLALFDAGLGASYRYQRIVYPMLAYVLSMGGNPTLVPISMVVLNVLSIPLGTYFLSRTLADMGTNPWYSLVYGLYGSQFLGLMTGLAEPLTFLFLMAGIYFWTRGKLGGCVVMFAIAALTKEAALLVVIAFVAHYVLKKKWRLALKISSAFLPYVIWQAALFILLGRPGFSSGPPFEFPLHGWLSGVPDTSKFVLVSLILIPMSFVPLFLLGANAASDFAIKKNYHPFVLMVLSQGVFMLVLPGLTAREPAAMLRVTQGLVLAALLFGSLIKSRRVLNYSVLWIATLAILINGSVGTGPAVT